jgi:hypothetical protein
MEYSQGRLALGRLFLKNSARGVSVMREFFSKFFAAVILFSLVNSQAGAQDAAPGSWLVAKKDYKLEYSVEKVVQSVVSRVVKKETASLVCEGEQKIGSKIESKIWLRYIWRQEEETKVLDAQADEKGLRLRSDDEEEEIFIVFDSVKKTVGEGGSVSVGGVTSVAGKVGEMTKVETEAGTFDALPVTIEVKSVATQVIKTVWYARGVGPVKMVEEVKAPASSTKTTCVLTKKSD